MRITKVRFILFTIFALHVSFIFALPPQTWDAIFNAQGQGDYVSAKINGSIRFTKFVHYPPSQTLSFKVSDSTFQFAVTGDIVATSDDLEAGLYAKCNETKEVWISCFNQPKTFKKEELVVDIKGVDLACGNDLYAVKNLKVRFPNKDAQEWWLRKLEQTEK